MITDTQKKNLIKAAHEALANPYPKGSATVYSAAVLTTKGNIYSSAQYFSDTYSLTLHGEQCALVHAAAHGEGEIAAVAVTSNEALKKGEFTYSCNMCKQLFWESQRRSKIPMTLFFVNTHNEIQEVSLDSMITYPWPK